MTTAQQMRLTFEDGPAEGLDVAVDRGEAGPPGYLFVRVVPGAVRLTREGRRRRGASRIVLTDVRDDAGHTYLRESTSDEGGAYRLVPPDERP